MTSIASVTRDVPGDHWIRWNEGQRRLAWAALGLRLREVLVDFRARAVSEPEELTVYDEKLRRVLMVVEVQTEPEGPR